jgi:uncharacterized protein (TIGR02594 family)
MTPFDQAQRFVGELKELPGQQDDPFIQFCFTKCGYGPDTPDETPWCSAFVNGICWLGRLARSKSAAARSWLTVGQVVTLKDAVPGYDVVILKRGTGPQPGPDVLAAPGHVGFFAGIEGQHVLVLGGNQKNAVTVAAFPVDQVIGVRRLKPAA